MKFNINENVRVKLTPFGRKVHKDDHFKFWSDPERGIFTYNPPIEDKDGWSTWQLWALMEAFGKYMYLGGPVCFETEIDVIRD